MSESTAASQPETVSLTIEPKESSTQIENKNENSNNENEIALTTSDGNSASITANSSSNNQLELPSTKSLFNVLTEKTAQDSLRTSRIVISGNCPSASSLTATQKSIENWLKKTTNDWDSQSTITGIFIAINTSSFIVLVESNTNNLQSLLHLIQDFSSNASYHPHDATKIFLSPKSSSAPIVSSSKVLIINEETLRVFPLFFSQAVQIQHEDRTELLDTNALLSSTFECVRNLLEVGREVRSRYDHGDIEHAQKYINQSAFVKHLTMRSPSEELIKELIQSDDLMDVNDMIQLMEAPIDAALDEDLVWPIQPYVRIYPKHTTV